MNVRDFLLLVLHALGGEVRGKTKLQKQVYFAGQLASVDVRLGYKAHYYGPYSPTVEDALDELWSIGLIDKHVNRTGQRGDRGYEKVRYDFALTDAGRRAVEQVRRACPEEAKAVSAAGERMQLAGDPHYMELAAAAKTHFILQRSDHPLAEAEISETAGNLDWQLGSQEIGKAAQFLLRLDLARRLEE